MRTNVYDEISAYDVGIRIYTPRTENDISMCALAKALGISKSTISRLEMGKAFPTIPDAVAIAKQLNTSLDYLVFGEKK